MLCYKRQGNYVVCNELPSGTVGWVTVVRGTVSLGVWEFESVRFSFFSPFSNFLSLVFFLALGLVLVLGLGLELGLGLGLGFETSWNSWNKRNNCLFSGYSYSRVAVKPS